MSKRNEAEQAQAWREKRGLSREQLAQLTGYQPITIYWFEKGMTPPNRNGRDREIREWVWTRYKMACAGADKQLRSGKSFDW